MSYDVFISQVLSATPHEVGVGLVCRPSPIVHIYEACTKTT